jgi:hypothetical protein
MIVLWALSAAVLVHLYLAFLASGGFWPDWLMFDQEDYSPEAAPGPIRP